MPPVIRKGAKALPSAGGDKTFLSLKDGDSVLFAPLVDLDDMISIDQVVVWTEGGNSPTWPYLGKEDPCHALGVEPRYRAFLPILTKEDGVKIFAFGVSVARQIAEIAGELGSVKGKMLKVRRSGSGLSTRYTIVAVGKEVNTDGHAIPDINKVLGPQTLEAVLEVLAEAGVTVPASKSTTPSAKTVKIEPDKAATPAAEDGDWGSIA